MAKLMGSDAPPPPEDAPLLARFASIGFAPGKPFDYLSFRRTFKPRSRNCRSALKKIES